VAMAICLILSACTPVDNTELSKHAQEADAKIAVLQSQLDALQKSVAADKQSRDFDRMMQDLPKIAYMTPGNDGYSMVQADLGTLTVQLANVEPYANGSRVLLRFGNPLSAAINGLKLNIDWGRVTKLGPDNENQKSKEITFTETLRSGAWTSVPIVLDGVPPSDLGFVRVRNITHTGIALSLR